MLSKIEHPSGRVVFVERDPEKHPQDVPLLPWPGGIGRASSLVWTTAKGKEWGFVFATEDWAPSLGWTEPHRDATLKQAVRARQKECATLLAPPEEEVAEADEG